MPCTKYQQRTEDIQEIYKMEQEFEDYEKEAFARSFVEKRLNGFIPRSGGMFIERPGSNITSPQMSLENFITNHSVEESIHERWRTWGRFDDDNVVEVSNFLYQRRRKEVCFRFKDLPHSTRKHQLLLKWLKTIEEKLNDILRMRCRNFNSKYIRIVYNGKFTFQSILDAHSILMRDKYQEEDSRNLIHFFESKFIFRQKMRYVIEREKQRFVGCPPYIQMETVVERADKERVVRLIEAARIRKRDTFADGTEKYSWWPDHPVRHKIVPINLSEYDRRSVTSAAEKYLVEKCLSKVLEVPFEHLISSNGQILKNVRIGLCAENYELSPTIDVWLIAKTNIKKMSHIEMYLGSVDVDKSRDLFTWDERIQIYHTNDKIEERRALFDTFFKKDLSRYHQF